MRPDVALDVRETSHMSAGMLAYVRALRRHLPRVAPDLRVAEIGGGDNFDLAEQAGLPLAIARLRPRLVHVPTPYVPRFLPAPAVVTVHDLIDLEFPQYAKRKVGPYWRFVVAPVLRRARAVLTDDEATVALLRRYAGVAPERVRVVPLGVDLPDPLPAPVVRARPYAFYAGNHRPHKDLATLVRAWETLPDHVALDLVLTGAPEPAFAHAARKNGELSWDGDAGEARVWALHRGAVATVQPALREGFGLPALEALLVGTPVIASETATPAILRPFVDCYPPGDVAALRALLARAVDERVARRDAVARAQGALGAFTWERTARETAAVYRALLG